MTEPVARLTLAEIPDTSAVRVTVSGAPADVAVTLRELMLRWPVPERVPDDLLPEAGMFAALPLGALVGRLMLSAREVGDLPPRLRWLLKQLQTELGPLNRDCVHCGRRRWHYCLSASGRPCSPHSVRVAS